MQAQLTGCPEMGTNMVDRTVCNPNLQTRARDVGIGAFVTVNPAQRGQQPAPRVLSDTMEAIIAVVWLASGKDLSAVKEAIAAMGL